MKFSYIPGILLVLVTALSNITMAQQAAPMQKHQTPESVNKLIQKLRSQPQRTASVTATNARPMQMQMSSQPAQRNVGTSERLGALLEERKNHPGEKPNLSMAKAQRGSKVMPASMQVGNRRRSFAAPKKEAQVLADADITSSRIASKLKRKR